MLYRYPANNTTAADKLAQLRASIDKIHWQKNKIIFWADRMDFAAAWGKFAGKAPKTRPRIVDLRAAIRVVLQQ